MEQNACWDNPSDLDVTREELFGADVATLPKIVDHKRLWTIYSQWVYSFTKMACWTYWMRHLTNLQSVLEWGFEHDPAPTRKKFVRVYKTPTYDPIVKWSSLQDQLKYWQDNWLFSVYYVIKKDDNAVEKMKEAISKGFFIYTGTTKCDWGKTKASKDKVMVMTSWPWHIIEWDWFDDNKEHFFIRKSSWRQAYDNWYMYLRYEDVGKLFSIYAVLPKTRTEEEKRVRAIIAEKKKNFVQEVRNWIYKWRPK